MSNKYLYIVIFFLLLTSKSIAQMNPDSLVWPGDVNNNGIVNHTDLLYLGASLGSQLVERDSISTNWEGMGAPFNVPAAFNNVLPSIAFADCDGSGFIEELDADAIEINYGLTHDNLLQDEFIKTPGLFSEIYFPTSETLFIEASNTYEIDISLGAENSIDEFYGLSFSIEFNTDFVDINSVFFTLENDWMDLDQQGLLQFQRINGNRLHVAISRKNRMSTNGGGVIGTVSLIIEDNVTELNSAVEIMGIENAEIVNQNLNSYQEVYEGNFIVDFINPIHTVRPDNFKIYPNPSSNGQFLIEGLDSYESIVITDIMGRKQNFIFDKNQIQIENFSNGIYFMEVTTKESKWIEKIVIQY